MGGGEAVNGGAVKVPIMNISVYIRRGSAVSGGGGGASGQLL